MDIIYTFIVLLFGLIIGSFLNVCIYRIPRQESIAWPGSHCPDCGYVLKWYDLFPVLSYIFLGGKCRQCRSHISWRYPLVEALTGMLFVLAYRYDGLSAGLIVHLVFLCLLVVIAFIDLEHLIIPNKLVLPGTVLGLLFTLITHSPTPISGFLSALGAGLFFFIIWFFYPQGMGEGDIKLALMLGAFLGWPLIPIAIFIAALSGTIVGVIYITTKGGGRKTQIPFGTFLAFGSVVALFYGERLVSSYLRLIGWQ
ncbi:MAG TPA: prepilin peptidase [Desulfobacteria bacterium]|nr:prepilin peptidase [Desulfobacteria bacterium]